MTGPVPGSGAVAALAGPPTATRTMATGLRIVAVRQGAVPLAQIRLRVPLPGVPGAQGGLLSRAILSGTSMRTAAEVEAAVQQAGGQLGATTDADEFAVGGSALAGDLPQLLCLLGEALASAAYPDAEVIIARDRLAQHARVARRQPGYVALETLNRLIYRGHPYQDQTPGPAEILSVTAAELRALHHARLNPAGASLFVVGNAEPPVVLDQAESALAGWTGSGRGRPGTPLTAMPAIPAHPRRIKLADWPGAPQACVRLVMPAPARSAPEYAAFQLAHLIFGGYFSSRLVENLREEKGLAYTPQSAVVHLRAGSVTLVSADVPPAAAAAALAEIWRELDRIAADPPSRDELHRARRYALGALRTGLASQAATASTLAAVARDGLGIRWLAEHSGRLMRTTAEQVAEAAQYLSRERALSFVLSDAASGEPELAALGDVSRC